MIAAAGAAAAAAAGGAVEEGTRGGVVDYGVVLLHARRGERALLLLQLRQSLRPLPLRFGGGGGGGGYHGRLGRRRCLSAA